MNVSGVDIVDGGRPLQRSALSAALDAVRPEDVRLTIDPGKISLNRLSSTARDCLDRLEDLDPGSCLWSIHEERERRDRLEALDPGSRLWSIHEERERRRLYDLAAFADEFFIATRCHGKTSVGFLMRGYLDEQIEREKRFKAGLKLILDGLSPKRNRQALRREARSSVYLPGENGGVTKHLVDDLRSHGSLSPAELTSERILNIVDEGITHFRGERIVPQKRLDGSSIAGLFPKFMAWFASFIKRKPVVKCGISDLKTHLLATFSFLNPVEDKKSEREYRKSNVVDRIVGRCRAQYLKFITWKATFDQSEIVTLIRRLDLKGMASLNLCRLDRSTSFNQWSVYYGNDFCRQSRVYA